MDSRSYARLRVGARHLDAANLRTFQQPERADVSHAGHMVLLQELVNMAARIRRLGL